MVGVFLIARRGRGEERVQQREHSHVRFLHQNVDLDIARIYTAKIPIEPFTSIYAEISIEPFSSIYAEMSIEPLTSIHEPPDSIPVMGERRLPHGGERPFHQKSSRLA